MRKILIITAIMLTAMAGWSQTLSIGLRLGTGVGGSLTTTGERHYYFFNPRQEVALTGSGSVDLVPLPEERLQAEFFARYKFKNKFFLQGGVTRIGFDMIYNLDPEVERKNNPGYEGAIMSSVATYNAAYNPYLTLGYFLFRSGVIKPFISAGVSQLYVTSSEVHTSGDFGTSSIDQTVIEDFGEINSTVTNVRLSAGFQFYDLHLELHAQQNITPFESGGNAMTKKATWIYVSLGYNFINFNLTKKKKQ